MSVGSVYEARLLSLRYVRCSLKSYRVNNNLIIWFITDIKSLSTPSCMERVSISQSFFNGSCRSLSPKSMDRIVRMGRVKEEEPHVKYLFCSLASDCLYTLAINQTIISVSNKKTSSCGICLVWSEFTPFESTLATDKTSPSPVQSWKAESLEETDVHGFILEEILGSRYQFSKLVEDRT